MQDDWSKAISEVAAQWVAYGWFLVLAIWGGAVSYISRVRKGRAPFSVIELVGECTISGFSGLITAYICKANDIGFFLTAALVGIAGHMGGRGIAMLESAVSRRVDSMLNPPSKGPQ